MEKVTPQGLVKNPAGIADKVAGGEVFVLEHLNKPLALLGGEGAGSTCKPLSPAAFKSAMEALMRANPEASDEFATNLEAINSGTVGSSS